MSTSDFHPSVRTVLASFLFVDIVGFSKVPAAQQHAFKAGLISVLHRHLSALHRGDYRLRDTGDGALLSFLNNPEHALYIALAIAEDLGQAAEGADLSLKDLRTGINLGAVKESIDVEQRPNYVGDGINAAQRIMDFAQPGQITASRSFMEAVATLDAAYAALFQHLGARADKHGRQHELFSLAPSGAVLERLRDEIVSARPAQVEVDFDLDMLAPPMTFTAPPLPASVPLYRRQRVLGLVAVVLATGLALLISRALDGHDTPTAPVLAPAAVPPPVPAEPSAKKPAAEVEPVPVATPASAAVAVPETAAASAAMPPQNPAAVPMPAAPGPAAAAAKPAPAPPPVREPAAPRTARKPSENPRQTSPPPADTAAPAPAISAQSSLRCSRIMQKAGVGEPLSPEEKKELANSCR